MKWNRRRKPMGRHPSAVSTTSQVDLAAQRVCETGAQLMAALEGWRDHHLVENEA